MSASSPDSPTRDLPIRGMCHAVVSCIDYSGEDPRCLLGCGTLPTCLFMLSDYLESPLLLCAADRKK